jgi:hypothetical protein
MGSDSVLRTTMPARRPWRTELRADLALPSSVLGPWDLAPLARAAARWASEIGLGFWRLCDISVPDLKISGPEKHFMAKSP